MLRRVPMPRLAAGGCKDWAGPASGALVTLTLLWCPTLNHMTRRPLRFDVSTTHPCTDKVVSPPNPEPEDVDMSDENLEARLT